MKKRVLFLKAPKDVKGNPQLTPRKLYPVHIDLEHQKIDGYRFFIHNNIKNGFWITEEEVDATDENKWKPVYNTEVYVGYATAVFATIGFVGLILLLLEICQIKK